MVSGTGLEEGGGGEEEGEGEGAWEVDGMATNEVIGKSIDVVSGVKTSEVGIEGIRTAPAADDAGGCAVPETGDNCPRVSCTTAIETQSSSSSVWGEGPAEGGAKCLLSAMPELCIRKKDIA